MRMTYVCMYSIRSVGRSVASVGARGKTLPLEVCPHTAVVGFYLSTIPAIVRLKTYGEAYYGN